MLFSHIPCLNRSGGKSSDLGAFPFTDMPKASVVSSVVAAAANDISAEARGILITIVGSMMSALAFTSS